ncbi:phosphotransferase [Paenibacillus sp. sgz500958]|uniref:phosphotransferase n=1 Tax=Paenibacillus sp. sgz500958 TaxID=3242475 RepID=UPI0036D2EF48
MNNEPNLKEINKLFQDHISDDEIINIQRLSGTTAGLIYRLESSQNHKYILKYDAPEQIQIVNRIFNAYPDSSLLPKVLYTAPDLTHYIYTYIEGTTHINRGAKREWLTKLVDELLNKYCPIQESTLWGRMEYPLQTWREFNEISIEEARFNIGDVLTLDDYKFVQSQVLKCHSGESSQDQRYLLHGDAGVHNFVFDRSSLIGVIDPSPMIGPFLYDFAYAFCSSPDDIHIDTLMAAFDHLKQGSVSQTRLIDEVSVQLYCRVGLSIKHHPQDLPEYLEAWEYWKRLCI